jgi:hypothetical protein
MYLPCVSVVGSYAFKNQTKLSYVGLDAALTIHNNAFEDCVSTSFTEINLPVCTTIGSSAFKGCSHLEKVVLPKMTTGIKADAFRGCVGLKTMSFPKMEVSTLASHRDWGLPGNVEVTCKAETLFSPQLYLRYNGTAAN